MASTEQEYEELIRRMADAHNDNDMEALDDILASDWVLHTIDAIDDFRPGSHQQETTREEYKESRDRNQNEKQDFTHAVTVISVDVNGDEIVEQTQLTGTLNEEAVEELPHIDEREFAINLNRRHRIEDGLIAETWQLRVPAETPDE